LVVTYVFEKPASEACASKKEACVTVEEPGFSPASGRVKKKSLHYRGRAGLQPGVKASKEKSLHYRGRAGLQPGVRASKG
jgi:hypothetical protein